MSLWSRCRASMPSMNWSHWSQVRLVARSTGLIRAFMAMGGSCSGKPCPIKARTNSSARLGEPALGVLQRQGGLLPAFPATAAGQRLAGLERLVDLEEVPDLGDQVHRHVLQ